MMDEQKILVKKNTLQVRIIKIVVFSLVLCFVMCACLAWYFTKVPETLHYLEEEKRPNTQWLVQYGSVLPPVILCAILLTLFYKFGKSYIPVSTQRDKAVISGIVFLFTYAVLLPIVVSRSSAADITPPAEGEEEIKTLIERSVAWFTVQILPFLLMVSYHIFRASSEKKELCENEEE